MLDGKLDSSVWDHALWTSDFVDIEGDSQPTPRYQTRAKMLWDDECLYIGAWMEEPHIWATLTEHDSIIYHDNDFEVFLDPDGEGHHYVELEVNPLNTTWDLLLNRPYRAGGKALSGWEFAGLRTAVHVDGTLNNPTDRDTSWSVEIAIPWHSLREITSRNCPPLDGDQWRINFSRVEWQHQIVDSTYCKIPETPEDNWVWSPQGVIDMHRPEHWGVLQFSGSAARPKPEKPLEDWPDQMALVRIWEAQELLRERTGRYTANANELGVHVDGLSLEATSSQFAAKSGSIQVDHELRFTRTTRV